MPKIRSNRSAAKRFRPTGGGGFKRGKSSARHLLAFKTRKRKRRLRRGGLVSHSDLGRVKRMLIES